jgi:hypothetical protein
MYMSLHINRNHEILNQIIFLSVVAFKMFGILQTILKCFDCILEVTRIV